MLFRHLPTTLTAILLTSAGCIRPPVPGPNPPPVTTHTEATTIRDESGRVKVDATANLVPDTGAPIPGNYASDRYFFRDVPNSLSATGGYLRVLADGYQPFESRVIFRGVGGGDINLQNGQEEVHLTPISHDVDPTQFSLNELAAIRGSMWSAQWDGPLGPRPGDPTNVLALDYLGCYGTEDRAKMLVKYTSYGFTHSVQGPIIDSGAYHNLFCPTNWIANWDRFLDLQQEQWNASLKPIVFLNPDNWTLEQLKAYEPFFRTPRAQKLIRIVVPGGWEPTKYGWSSNTWAEFGKWAREVFPNALVLLHTVCDVDAPVGTDSRGDDNGHPNGEGWTRVAPYYHGWLTQTCTYAHGPDRIDDPPFTNFQNWVRLFDPRVRGSYQDRFQNGYAGWPTFSAWGNSPLRVYAAEYTSYWRTWDNIPEGISLQWGDSALNSGADGYLDGGTLPVPTK